MRHESRRLYLLRPAAEPARESLTEQKRSPERAVRDFAQSRGLTFHPVSTRNRGPHPSPGALVHFVRAVCCTIPMTRARIPVPQDEITAFCLRNQIRSLALFGSVLRDDFGPHSDVDILVDFEPDAAIGMLALGRIQRELSSMLARPVDLAPRRGLKLRLRASVLASSEELYAR